jgi:hypothetical protein
MTCASSNLPVPVLADASDATHGYRETGEVSECEARESKLERMRGGDERRLEKGVTAPSRGGQNFEASPVPRGGHPKLARLVNDGTPNAVAESPAALASSTHVKADNPVPLPKPVRDGQRDHFRTRRRVAFDQIKAQHDRPSWRGREGSMFQVQCPLSSPRDVPVCADMELHTPNRPSPAHFAREHIHGRDCAFSRCALSAPCSRAFDL